MAAPPPSSGSPRSPRSPRSRTPARWSPARSLAHPLAILAVAATGVSAAVYPMLKFGVEPRLVLDSALSHAYFALIAYLGTPVGVFGLTAQFQIFGEAWIAPSGEGVALYAAIGLCVLRAGLGNLRFRMVNDAGRFALGRLIAAAALTPLVALSVVLLWPLFALAWAPTRPKAMQSPDARQREWARRAGPTLAAQLYASGVLAALLLLAEVTGRLLVAT